MKAYQRIEDGVITQVSIKEALEEVNTAMMEGRKKVKMMSSSHGHHTIEYRDGRKVTLDEIDVPEQEEEAREWSTTNTGFTAHRFDTTTHKALCNKSILSRGHTRIHEGYTTRSWNVETSVFRICPRCDAK